MGLTLSVTTPFLLRIIIDIFSFFPLTSDGVLIIIDVKYLYLTQESGILPGIMKDDIRQADLARINILYDLYGPLLAEKQRRAIELYFLEDQSYSEIAEQEHISRQAVFDALKHGISSLESYETRLGLIMKLEKAREHYDISLRQLDERIKEATRENPDIAAGRLQKIIQKEVRRIQKEIKEKIVPYV